ncbi:MAG: hypothetical protein IK006_01485 [Bacteroidaceae bacterium]|nr:hypothetical protein [Bacteroidaceae bacterium]
MALNSNRQIVIVMSLMILSFVSCSQTDSGKEYRTHVTTALMDSAEQVMNDEPQRALVLMDSIDSRSIRSKERQARYALLYSEILYKNWIEAPSDSLIMTAVRHYSINKDKLSLFRSYYMLGCIYYEMGRNTDAAVALSEAERLVGYVYDGYRLGLLYSMLGDVFFYSYDFIQAENYYQHAFDYYEKVDKTSHKNHALYGICGCMIQMEKYRQAHTLLEELEEWGMNNGDMKFVSNCLICEMICSLHLLDMESARNESSRYTKLFGESNNDIYKLSVLAKYSILDNQLSHAEQLIIEGWNSAQSISDSVKLFNNQSLLDEHIGRYDSALMNLKKSMELQDRQLHGVLRQPVVTAQKDYYINLSETESLKLSRNRRTSVLVSLSLLLSVIVVSLLFRSSKLKSEAEKQELLLTIKELKLNENTKDEMINLLRSRVNTLFSRPYIKLDHIFDKILETDELIELKSGVKDENGRETFYNKKMEEFYKYTKNVFAELSSRDNQRELDRIINSTCGNLMTRLSDKNLNLTERDLLILRLSIVGFSTKTISKLTGIQTKAIYQQRGRTIDKISDYSQELSDEISKILRIS